MTDNKQDETAENSKSHKGTVALVAGVTAAVAAGAAYLYGPKGQENQEKLRGWMLKVKGDVMSQLEEAEEVTRAKYEEMVDQAIAKYGDVKQAKEPEVEELRGELKARFKDIKERLKDRTGKAANTGKKLAKAAAKGAAAGVATEIAKKNTGQSSSSDSEDQEGEEN